MSMQWSNPSGNSGIVEKVDEVLGTTSDSYTIESKVRDGNLALDAAFAIIFAAGGRWKFDDGNHTDFPYIETALVAGQRDYDFSEDENGNLTLEVNAVFLRLQDSGGVSGVYQKMTPVDEASENGTSDFWDGRNVQATPERYSKNGMSISLETPTAYSQASSLKAFISREASYFTVDDTTKKPGFAGTFHKYVAKYMQREYAEANRMWDLFDRLNDATKNDSIPSLEAAMTAHYDRRARDEKVVAKGRITKFM